MLIKVHPDNPAPRHIKMIAETIKDGGVVIIPTDSVYAVACGIHSPKAYERILQIKGIKKKEANFSFLFNNLSQITDYTLPFTKECYKLMRKSLPGPFTFILRANNKIPKLFQSKKKTIGIRVPDNKIVSAIIDAVGTPLMTTSLKGDDELLEYFINPELIYEAYGKQVDMVVDGGYGDITPSTVISCLNDEIEVIREGKGKI